MQIKKSKRLFVIPLKFKGGITRSVNVRAVTREIAEQKAMKRNPNAIGVEHGT